jgi:hypothetical protein
MQKIYVSPGKTKMVRMKELYWVRRSRPLNRERVFGAILMPMEKKKKGDQEAKKKQRMKVDGKSTSLVVAQSGVRNAKWGRPLQTPTFVHAETKKTHHWRIHMHVCMHPCCPSSPFDTH